MAASLNLNQRVDGPSKTLRTEHRTASAAGIEVGFRFCDIGSRRPVYGSSAGQNYLHIRLGSLWFDSAFERVPQLRISEIRIQLMQRELRTFRESLRRVVLSVLLVSTLAVFRSRRHCGSRLPPSATNLAYCVAR